MRSIGRAFSFVLPLFVVACGVGASPPPVGRTSGALDSPSVSTDASSYAPGSTVTVTYAGLPGSATDWIAIAPAGSDDTSYVAFVYANGQTSGTATFPVPMAGSYVARAFSNNTYTLLAESSVFSSVSSTISTNHLAYSPGSTVTVTYAALPGNANDWIAIAPAGSDNTSYVDFVYTNGQTSGTATFAVPAAGSYVARAFSNNTFMLLAESSVFSSVTATISTDQSTYAPGATVTVTYAGLPGNANDWIAIAPSGSGSTSYVAFVYTNGQTSGTAAFVAPAAGSYVARAFSNNTFTLLAESSDFTVSAGTGTPTISTDQSTYTSGATVTVTYAGLPGNPMDWIAIAAAGSDNTSYVAYVYTNGQTSGTATFVAPADGSYVARAFSNNMYTLLAESSAFTVATGTGTPTISTDQSTYTSGATVTVTYAGLPGNPMDWIAIAAAGSDNTSYVAYVYTNGQTSGTATFVAPAAGSYVARAFSNNTYTLLAESSAFTVATGTGTPTISTDQSTYTTGATVTVTYAGLPGNAKDWIAIAPAGSANTSYVDFAYTNGQISGTATFVAGAPGIYVARAFTNNTYNLAAESAVFTECDAGGMSCFVASLSGAEEVPPSGSTATGSASFVFDPGTNTISYYLQHTVVGATASHIHQKAPGLNGPVIVPFTLVGQTASGSAVLTAGQAADLLAGNLYTNVHSPTFPGGEIRGQILRPGQILFVATLTGAQQTTPNASTATGTGSVIFDPATNNISYQLVETVVNATAAHIHQAPAGVDGPVIIPFTLVGQGASGTATLTAGQATDLQAAGLYMNVHSAAFPVGEIRGQLLRPGT